MKYEVTYKVEGYITQIIEADDEHEATVKAFNQLDDYRDVQDLELLDYEFIEAQQQKEPEPLTEMEEHLAEAIAKELGLSW